MLGFCAAVAGGLALAAVSLIPLGELLWLSADLHDRSGQSIDVHLELKEVIGVFMPDYWGRPTQTSFRPLLLERALYVGRPAADAGGGRPDRAPQRRAHLASPCSAA